MIQHCTLCSSLNIMKQMILWVLGIRTNANTTEVARDEPIALEPNEALRQLGKVTDL